MTKQKEKTGGPVENPNPTYGFMSVTLGEVLKNRLDEFVTTTGGNRSKIVAAAVEQYLEQLPGLQKQRKERQQTIRDRAFLIVLARVLHAFRVIVLNLFDARDALPDDLYRQVRESVTKLEEWLAARIPPGDGPPSSLKVSEVEGGVLNFERACVGLSQTLGGQRWGKILDRWRAVYKRERTAAPE